MLYWPQYTLAMIGNLTPVQQLALLEQDEDTIHFRTMAEYQSWLMKTSKLA